MTTFIQRYKKFSNNLVSLTYKKWYHMKYLGTWNNAPDHLPTPDDIINMTGVGVINYDEEASHTGTPRYIGEVRGMCPQGYGTHYWISSHDDKLYIDRGYFENGRRKLYIHHDNLGYPIHTGVGTEYINISIGGFKRIPSTQYGKIWYITGYMQDLFSINDVYRKQQLSNEYNKNYYMLYSRDDPYSCGSIFTLICFCAASLVSILVEYSKTLNIPIKLPKYIKSEIHQLHLK